MKIILAWVLMVALVNVITICPVLAGGMRAEASCCPHSTGPHIPCTESTARNCPYVLLEKAKAERGVSVVGFDAAATPATAELHPLDRFSSLIQPEHFQDSSGSYLFLRVLRL